MHGFDVLEISLFARTHRREIRLLLRIPPRPGSDEARYAQVGATAREVRIKGVGRRLAGADRAGIEEALRSRWPAISSAITAFYEDAVPGGRLGDFSPSVGRLTARLADGEVGDIKIRLLGRGQFESLDLVIPATAVDAQITELRGTWPAPPSPETGARSGEMELFGEMCWPPLAGEALADRLRSRWAVFAAPPGALEAIIERLATMGPSTRAGVAAIAAAVTGATARPD